MLTSGHMKKEDSNNLVGICPGHRGVNLLNMYTNILGSV
jgi:hypothetical protein